MSMNDTSFASALPLLTNRYSYFLRRQRNLERWTLVGPICRLDHVAKECHLERSVKQLLERQPSLCLRGNFVDGAWQEWLPDSPPTHCIDRLRYEGRLSEVDLNERVTAAVQHARDGIRFPDALLRIVCIELLASMETLLIVVVHHLLVDEHAFRRLIDELLLLYHEARTGIGARLAPATVLLAEFAKQSMSYWCAREREELAYWCDLPWSSRNALGVAGAHRSMDNIEAFTTQSVATIPVGNEREFLAHFYRQARVPMVEVLVEAIAAAYRDWTDTALNLAMVLHGRSGIEKIDVSRTIAWISEAVPLAIDTLANPGTYPTVREQLARAHARGRSYGALRYLSHNTDVQCAMKQLPESLLSLNVKLRTTTAQARPTGSLILPLGSRTDNANDDTQRVFLLSAGAYFEQGRFCLSWDYSRKLFDATSIDTFSRLCMQRFIEGAQRIGVAMHISVLS